MKVSDEGVVESDGVRRRHVVVFVDEEKMDLTKKRQGESEVGFDGPAMRGIVPNRTKVEGGLSLAQTGGVSSVREARARDVEYREHGALDPV